MNKIILVEDVELKSNTYDLKLESNKKIVIDGNVELNNFDNNNIDLNINVKSNSILTINKCNLVTKDTNFYIKIDSNSTATLNFLLINKGKNRVVLNVLMAGNNSKCKVLVRITNVLDGNIDFICNGTILEKTINNIFLEDLKGLITNNDVIKISPNMFVYTNEVEANHLVTIGSFDKSSLFYLMSLGISEKKAKKMLKTSFINSILNDYLKKKMEVDTYE